MEDVEKRRARVRKYQKTEKGKEARKRYRQSEKGKEMLRKARKRYRESKKGKETERKYEQTEGRKEKAKEYYLSEKGRKTRNEYQTKQYREKVKGTDRNKQWIYDQIRLHPEDYPLDDKCIFCGRTERLEHGHLDYEDQGYNYITVCHQCNRWMDLVK